ncbi:MAG: DNA-3-methyladenine glycosylase I [Gammaproteobacteria bacterium]
MSEDDHKTRCWWCGDDELYQRYHDQEWGVPIHDDQHLFEFLCLEGAQAGLSWITILRKREHYRRVFDRFDAEKIANYDPAKIASLLADPGIVRNKLKVNGFVKNARAYLDMLDQGLSLDSYLWNYVDGVPVQNHWRSMGQIPANTAVSDAMSKDLKKRGFTFVGSTICYALMQAAGLVNDHITDCYRHVELDR